MKIYYTTDNSIDEQLQQICPFKQEHHFHRDDDTEFTMAINVGCLGCQKCPFCYGAGFHRPYGDKPSKWILIPKFFLSNSYNYEKEEKHALELGLKQFRAISCNNYIKCAKVYKNIPSKIKFKIWWWHNIGTNIQEVKYKLFRLYFHLRYR